MAIDGLIILDNTGRPIIQSGFRSTSPAYPFLHIDAFNSALAKARSPSDLDPVLQVPTLVSPAACCHREYGGLRFLCPISGGDVDPLVAFSFLQTFIEILQEYFGTVSAATLKDNFDVVYQLLEETLDSGGHPLTTFPNALRDIVLPPSLLTKLLSNINTLSSSTHTQSSLTGVGNGAFSSPIPWRKPGLKYSSNEIYFDVVEELRAIVDKVPLSSSVWGAIETNSKLSGTPDLLLVFKNPETLADCAFHPCVRLQRYTRDKTLSFVPPDGRFTLFTYRVSKSPIPALLPTPTPTSTTAIPAATATLPSTVDALRKDLHPIPLLLKAAIDTTDASACTFEFTLTNRFHREEMEDVRVEWGVGRGVGGVGCVLGQGGIGGRGVGGVGVGVGVGVGGGGNASSTSTSTGASWMFDTKKQVIRWDIPRLAPTSTCTLRGTFAFTPPANTSGSGFGSGSTSSTSGSSSSSTSTSGSAPTSSPRPARAVRIRFAVPNHSYSALRVEALRVSGETYKPYRGVRWRSTGDVEWRV